VLPVPRSWSDVTPSFVTQAIAAREPGAVVAGALVEDVADGTNARARVRLTYAAGDGPPSVFVKRAGRPLNRLALLALGALGTEARLAACGAILPIEHPRPYGGGIDRRRLQAVVVMDDVANTGGRPNDAMLPLSVAEVRSGLEGLATLHAAWWNRPLPPPLGFLRPWRLGGGWALVSVANLARGLRRLRSSAPPADLPARGVDARRLGGQFRRSASLAAAGDRAVLHGDPHPGNTYALPGHRTGFLDWQLVRVGNWSHDVGYFLVSSLDPTDRRTHERALLAGYLEALWAAGVAAPGWDAAWERYRATPAFGLATWLHTLSFGTFQPAGVCLATIRRFAAAYEDLDTARSALLA
jgi:hypothetical protein